MKQVLTVAAVFVGVVAIPFKALAHCPLCTIGAGVLAVGATTFGVKYAVAGLFIGAFGWALGAWLAKYIKKQYVRYQNTLVALASFLLTVLPLRPLLRAYWSFYLAWFGEYGTIFNRTYVIDKFLVGSIVGALVLIASPVISKKITERRGITWPYQGVSITLGLLVVGALFLQFGL